MMGEKNFEAFVKELALVASKDFLVQKQHKISEAAVKKYKKSTEFKTDTRIGLAAQKKLDAQNETKSNISKLTTMMKTELKRLPPHAVDEMVEKYGLQAIKRKVDEEKKPELRPRWIS